MKFKPRVTKEMEVLNKRIGTWICVLIFSVFFNIFILNIKQYFLGTNFFFVKYLKIIFCTIFFFVNVALHNRKFDEAVIFCFKMFLNYTGSFIWVHARTFDVISFSLGLIVFLNSVALQIYNYYSYKSVYSLYAFEFTLKYGTSLEFRKLYQKIGVLEGCYKLDLLELIVALFTDYRSVEGGYSPSKTILFISPILLASSWCLFSGLTKINVLINMWVTVLNLSFLLITPFIGLIRINRYSISLYSGFIFYSTVKIYYSYILLDKIQKYKKLLERKVNK